MAVAMSSEELTSPSSSNMYRPEIYFLERQWRRHQELKEQELKGGSVLEPDSGLIEDAVSESIQSLEASQSPAEDEKHREEDIHTDFFLPYYAESGFQTMEDAEEEVSDSCDEQEEDDGLITDRDLPKPTERDPEDIDDSPTPGQTVFHYFAVSGDPRYFLASLRPLIIAQDEEGDTALHYAIICNRLPALHALMDVLDDELCYCVNIQNKLGQTLLHLATWLKQYNTIRKLIHAEARIDVQDWQGNSPVHIACRQGDLKAMAALLAQKEHARIYETKDLNAMNYTGMTPMHLATLAQSRDCLWYLKELGADVDIRDGKRGGTPLHYAIEMHNLRLVTFLVFECKADVNPVTYDGYSPLHTASGYGLDAIVALLIAAGADVTVINDEGETPKDTATTTASKSLCTPLCSFF